jgi:hypothetical protein
VPSRNGPLVAASRPLLRSTVLGAVAVLVSLAGHVAGGGQAPDTAGLLLALAVAVSAYRLLLAGRERSWPTLVAVLGLAQVVLHVTFTSWTDATTMTDTHAAHHAMAATSGRSMLAGHLVATLVLAWVLRLGEAALWSTARRIATRLCRPVITLVSGVLAALSTQTALTSRWRPSSTRPAADLARRQSRWATGGRARRGPPRRGVRTA